MFLQIKHAEESSMDVEEKNGGSYRVEVSGWDSGESFFVEKTLLSWNEDGSKRVLLRTPLNEGTLVFVRLVCDSPSGRGIPVTYQVQGIGKNVSEQGHEVQLERLHPKVSESRTDNSLVEHEPAKM
jgi:hypothetical protein